MLYGGVGTSSCALNAEGTASSAHTSCRNPVSYLARGQTFVSNASWSDICTPVTGGSWTTRPLSGTSRLTRTKMSNRWPLPKYMAYPQAATRMKSGVVKDGPLSAPLGKRLGNGSLVTSPCPRPMILPFSRLSGATWLWGKVIQSSPAKLAKRRPPRPGPGQTSSDPARYW